GTSACIFSVILHRNSLLGASPAASFLYNLTKNLAAHLHHQLCAVLPFYQYTGFYAVCQELMPDIAGGCEICTIFFTLGKEDLHLMQELFCFSH
ncbi:MAG: hypothetical protein IKN55_10455, partial [Oscillospiraceae bacterium]|nr:hypothetical protein [Oscillospiraceae bacterium]